MNSEMPSERIRIVLLDEIALLRTSLSRYLASDPALEVAGECGTASEAWEILKQSAIDVLVFDCDCRTEQGDDIISAARRNGYQGRFLVLAGTLDGRRSALMLKSGASGIFLKSDRPERLIQAIKDVARGEMWVDPKIIQLLADQLVDRTIRVDGHKSAEALGDRERGVLFGVVEGLSNREIARNLGLSESSVKNVLQRLFAMTSVRTRSQLVRLAMENSLGGVVVRNPDEVTVSK